MNRALCASSLDPWRRARPTPTDITRACCGRTSGAPRRTRSGYVAREHRTRHHDRRRRQRPGIDHGGPRRARALGTVVGIDAVPDHRRGGEHSRGRPWPHQPHLPRRGRVPRSISRTRAPTSCTPTRPCTTSPRPADALREFARVARPGGIIAAREVDYEGGHLASADPGADRSGSTSTFACTGERWRARRAAVVSKSRAQEAGLRDIVSTASVWLWPSPTRIAPGGVGHGPTACCTPRSPSTLWSVARPTEAALQRTPTGWLEWAAAPDGWLPPCRTARSSHDPGLGG